MSIVTTVTLVVGSLDDDCVEQINASMAALGIMPLTAIAGWGGDKAAQVHAYGAAYSHYQNLDVASLGRLIARLPWELPERTILLVQPEDGPASVFRPPVTDDWFRDVGPDDKVEWLAAHLERAR